MNSRLRSRLTWYGLGGYALLCLVFEQQPIRLAGLLVLGAYMAGLSVWCLLRQRDVPRRIRILELVIDLALLLLMAAIFLVGRP